MSYWVATIKNNYKQQDSCLYEIFHLTLDDYYSPGDDDLDDGASPAGWAAQAGLASSVGFSGFSGQSSPAHTTRFGCQTGCTGLCSPACPARFGSFSCTTSPGGVRTPATRSRHAYERRVRYPAL